ncbi:hypothetical protein [Achromobacter sp. PAB15]|uniref:hypothetical protein n=1 Tax=Achromobacter sp. PAB15 TaxID=3233048 RepID=UPI003F92718E
MVRADTAKRTQGLCQSCAAQTRPLLNSALSAHPAYTRWKTMMSRCQSDDEQKKPYYKERGITVCKEWQDPRAFIAWAESSGFSPILTLDRIDNDLGYSPENCRWITRTGQARNTRANVAVLVDGRFRLESLAEAADMLETSQDRIYKALKYGWKCMGHTIERINEAL